MPPVYRPDSFTFKEGEPVIEPTKGSHYDRDPNKYHLDGVDTFSGDRYPIASNIDDLATAQMFWRGYKRNLEETQPTETSGGEDGIQDRVNIIYPTANPQ